MKRRRPVLELHTNSTYSRDGSNSSSASSSATLGFEPKPVVDFGSSNEHIVRANDAVDPTMAWQVCVDETTGYTYYWNMVTNQVTWDMPAEYAAYEKMTQHYDTRSTGKSIENQLLSISEDKNSLVTDGNLIKSSSRNGKNELFPAYGPLHEDEINMEETEAKKMACARKRLMSYKTEKLKVKPDDPVKEIPDVNSHSNLVTSQNTDGKILFVPTPDEVKEHPIFSNSSALQSANNSLKFENTISKPVVTTISSNKHTDSNNKLRLIAENYSDSDEDDNDEDDGEDSDDDDDLDDMIIARLREKALLLKQLGGDVPKEMMSILDETKSASDIIDELEREMTVPSSNERSSTIQSGSTKAVPDVKQSQPPTTKPSDNNSRLSDLVNDARSLFAGRVGRKTKQTKIQRIKLSSRAKELIKTSVLTAKARATNFVETEDGLKPAEEVARMNEEKAALKEKAALEKKAALLAEETSTVTPEAPNLSELDKFQKEIDALSSTLANEVGAKSPPLSKIDCENHESTSSASRKIEDDRFSFQRSFVVLNPKRPKVLDDIEKRPANVDQSNMSKYASLVNKCEEFLESVKKSSIVIDSGGDQTKSTSPPPSVQNLPAAPLAPSENSRTVMRFDSHGKAIVEDMDIDIDEVLNTKNEDPEKSMKDLSQLIMEKLKFLSNNKDDVAPVQVMAIQIETLVGAWQNKALNSQYLSDWLNASVVHLKSIEESASPEGWACEWDRSYGRYYYRNLKTNAIQWDFPEGDESPGTPSSSVEDAAPPPLPANVEELVPPPPPIISCDRESRKRRPASPPVSRMDLDSKMMRTAMRDASPPPPPAPSLISKFAGKPSSPPPLPVMPPPLPSVPPPSSPPPPPLPPPTTPTIGQPPLKEANQFNSRAHEALLDSFYSDLATIEETSKNSGNDTALIGPAPQQPQKEGKNEAPSAASSSSQWGNNEEKVIKKKKKTVRLDSSLSLKKKGLQGLVAKWQNVNSSM